jgi:hypothetical protein
VVTASFARNTAALVVEYKNVIDFADPGGHFFYSADPAEQRFIESGGAGRWVRTERSFKLGGSAPLCRFYGSVSPGPNSHFFTLDPDECTALKNAQISPTPKDRQQWNYEGFGFTMIPANADKTCMAGTQPVYRAYNNAFSPTGTKNFWDSNHRFSTRLGDINEVVALGWRNEGVVFCAPL